LLYIQLKRIVKTLKSKKSLFPFCTSGIEWKKALS